METILKKGRIRLKRGILTNFKDLPLDKQLVFIEIKQLIEEYFMTSKNVYVFGSHKHGYWDEFSDYDVVLNAENECFKLNEFIKEKMTVKVNIICTDREISQILIP